MVLVSVMRLVVQYRVQTMQELTVGIQVRRS